MNGMQLAFGYLLGQRMATSAGVADPVAARRIALTLGVVGLTPVGLVVAQTLARNEAEAETAVIAPAPGVAVVAADPTSKMASKSGSGPVM